jgi:hypothetical protein
MIRGRQRSGACLRVAKVCILHCSLFGVCGLAATLN